MNKKIIGIVGMIIFFFYIFDGRVYAKEGAALSYSASAVLPENQISRENSYFDLLVKPGENQQVAIKLSNNSEEQIKLQISPNTARTTSNGTVDYSGMKLRNTSNLFASFEDITSPKKIVELAGKSQKIVTFDIKIPKESFEGVILGGFYIQEIQKLKENDQKDGIHIQNKFSIIIGCQIRTSQNIVEKDFSLEQIYLDNYGGYFSVITDIHNNAPQLISFYDLSGKIQNDEGEIVHTFKKDHFSMAPNSIFSFPERIKTSELAAGDYVMKINIRSRGKEEWDLQKKFTIKANQRDNVLSDSMDNRKSPLQFLLWSLLILLVIICLLLFNQLRRKLD